MKEFFNQLNRMIKPGRLDIIEKDYHLHRLLHDIAQDDYLHEKLVFKGGTCLLKAYLGYYRFSEDLDFTWKDTTLWRERTPSQTRKQCSKEIDKISGHLIEISENLGLIFRGDKGDTSQVEIGSGGRMARFFIGYDSVLLGIPSKMKVEINFVDKMLYPLSTQSLESLTNGLKNDALRYLFREQWDEYSTNINIECYDPREIYTDKARAIMTRIVYKLRDVIDIYTLENKFGYTLSNFKEHIKRKTKFVMDIYSRYKETLEMAILPDIDLVSDDETKLLIIPTTKGFHQEIKRIHNEIQNLRSEFINETQ